MDKKIKLELPDGNEPTCPACGTWNAMLRWADKDDNYVDYLKCRDCGYKVLVSLVIYVDIHGQETFDQYGNKI